MIKIKTLPLILFTLLFVVLKFRGGGQSLRLRSVVKLRSFLPWMKCALVSVVVE